MKPEPPPGMPSVALLVRARLQAALAASPPTAHVDADVVLRKGLLSSDTETSDDPRWLCDCSLPSTPNPRKRFALDWGLMADSQLQRTPGVVVARSRRRRRSSQRSTRTGATGMTKAACGKTAPTGCPALRAGSARLTAIRGRASVQDAPSAFWPSGFGI